MAAEGNEVTLTLVGKAAHGSTPEHGVNAATYLATFLKDYSFDKDAKAFLNVAAKYLHENHDGKKLGIDYQDELIGSFIFYLEYLISKQKRVEKF